VTLTLRRRWTILSTVAPASGWVTGGEVVAVAAVAVVVLLPLLLLLVVA
jgi:hypothetical protein